MHLVVGFPCRGFVGLVVALVVVVALSVRCGARC